MLARRIRAIKKYHQDEENLRLQAVHGAGAVAGGCRAEQAPCIGNVLTARHEQNRRSGFSECETLELWLYSIHVYDSESGHYKGFFIKVHDPSTSISGSTSVSSTIGLLLALVKSDSKTEVEEGHTS